MQKLADQQAAVAKAAMKAVKGEDSLADAIKKAGKAAARTLMPFDEIHTIQKDMAGAGMGEIGDLDTPAIDMPDLGFPGMGDFMDGFGAALDELKPTFKGFLSWMWEGAKELFNKYFEGWDWWEILLLGLGPATMLGVLIYKNWDKVAEWAKKKFGPMWEGVKVKWEEFKIWAGNLWEGAKTKWEAFKTWCTRHGRPFGPRFRTSGSALNLGGNLWRAPRRNGGLQG